MEWLQANWISLLIVIVAILLFVGWVAYLCYKRGLKQVAIDFIVWAEKNMESEEGSTKFKAVVNRIVSTIPLPFSLFITTSAVESLVQAAFDSIKEALDYRPTQIEQGSTGIPSSEKGE